MLKKTSKNEKLVVVVTGTSSNLKTTEKIESKEVLQVPRGNNHRY
jgi:hypothetical protein